MGKTQETGKLGEDLAVKYLENNGYKILTRNYRKPWGELDIIGFKNNLLIFFEVKSQKSGSEFRPEENINRHKKSQLSRVIRTYLKEFQYSENQDWQVDAISIVIDSEKRIGHIKHLENIILSD